MQYSSELNKQSDQPQIEFANFGLRLGAYLIDVLVLFLGLFFVLQFVLMFFKYYFESQDEIGVHFIAFGFFMYIIGFPLLIAIYQALFESSKFQGTPGKIAVNIKVINRYGERIGFMQALGRNLGKILSSFIMWIGYLMVLWTENNQGLHDLMANTYVIVSRN